MATGAWYADIPDPRKNQTIPWAGQVPYAHAQGINTFMAEQALQPFQTGLPGYEANKAQEMSNVTDFQQGRIPLDVQRSMGIDAAESAVGGGAVAGSPRNTAALNRALGLTSLDLMGKGAQMFGQAQANLPVPEIWNPASLWQSLVIGREQEAAARRGMDKAAGIASAAAKPQPKEYSSSTISPSGIQNYAYKFYM